MHPVVRNFVAALLIAVLQYRGKANAAFKCWSCASQGLIDNWQITGLQLPSTFSSQASKFFLLTDCDTPAADKTINGACSDFCFTLVVTPVAINGSLGNAQTVRGCHADFTNYPMSSATITSTSGGGLCDIGFVTRYSNTTQPVKTPAGYQWCNVDLTGSIPCNKLAASDVTAKSVSTCDVNNPTQRTCYDCVDGSTARPCTSTSTGQSPYCYKSDLWINNQHFVTRSLSDINPLAPGSTGNDGSATQPNKYEGKCGRVAVTYPAYTRASIAYSGYDCYCNTYDYCNGVGTIAISIVTFMSAFLFVILNQQH